MTKKQVIEDEFLARKKSMLEDEENLSMILSSGNNTLDELGERGMYYLKGLENEEVDFSRIFSYLEHSRSEFNQEVSKKRQELEQQQRENEENYAISLSSLEIEEENNV